MNTQNFKLREGDIFLETDGGTVNLADAVKILALQVYGDFRDRQKEHDIGERNRMEYEITLETAVLNSLTNTLTALSDRGGHYETV